MEIVWPEAWPTWKSNVPPLVPMLAVLTLNIEELVLLTTSVTITFPTTFKLPVITAEPENGNPAPLPPPPPFIAYDAVKA
jgi:hypothetical protein